MLTFTSARTASLRFVYLNEVKDHIVHDHPEHAAVLTLDYELPCSRDLGQSAGATAGCSSRWSANS